MNRRYVRLLTGVLLSFALLSAAPAHPKDSMEHVRQARKHVAEGLAKTGTAVMQWRGDITQLAAILASDEGAEIDRSATRSEAEALMARGRDLEPQMATLQHAFRDLTALLNRHRVVTPRDLAATARFRHIVGTWYAAGRKLEELHQALTAEPPQPQRAP